MKESMPLNYIEGMPRIDYPRPAWVRKDWLCLNGSWEFAYDYGRSGEGRGMVTHGELHLEPLTVA